MRDDLDIFARQVEASTGAITHCLYLCADWASDVLVDERRGERNRKELRRTVDKFGEILAVCVCSVCI